MERNYVNFLGWILTFLIIINSKAIYAQSCWNFDSPNQYDWTNVGEIDWQWSGSSTPSKTYIPTFSASSPYMWLQTSYPGSTGILEPYYYMYWYQYDTIEIKIWRHLVCDDGTDRPVLSIIEQDGKIHQLHFNSYMDDSSWVTLSLTCGSGGDYQQCCSSYPCYGFWRLNGTILAVQEFFALDYISINQGCSYSTTTSYTTLSRPTDTTSSRPTDTTSSSPPYTTYPPYSTTTPSCPPYTTYLPYSPTSSPRYPTSSTPSEDNWCCQFETIDLCSWNLHESSIGWRWSSNVLPGFTVPSHSGYYIWEQDESSEIYSSQLTNLPDDSYFQIDYYFNTANIDQENYLEFSFQSDTGAEIIWNTLSSNESYWHTTTFTSATGGVCNGYSKCNGVFYVRSHNRVGNAQVAAIDNFNVNNACH